jgi:lysophospholipase L1-like esterase
MAAENAADYLTADQTNAAYGGPKSVELAQQLSRKLDAGEDATWLNFGDSLSDASTDWVSRTASHLARIYPGHTVGYQTATTAGWYGSESTLSVGTGGGALTVRNAAVGGYSSEDWATTITSDLLTGITPDLITVFLSHNDPNTEAEFKADFEALLDAIRAEWPDAPIVVGVQNQSATQPEYTENHRAWILDVCRDGRTGVAVHEHVWDAFGRTEPVTAYYVDNVHPTTAGVIALTNAWLVALGIPAETAFAVVESVTDPLAAKINAIINSLSDQLDPLQMLSWEFAYWAGNPAWSNPGDGVAVSAWPDATANGWDLAQATGASQPIFRASTAAFNDRATVEFDGSNDSLFLASGVVLAQPFTLVVVGSVDTLNHRTFLDVHSSGSSNAYYNGMNATSGYKWQMSQGTALRGGTPEAGVPVLYVARFDGSSSNLDIDGTTVATGNAGTASLAEIRMGLSSTGAAGTAPLDGHIAFAAAFDGDPTEDELWPMFLAWVSAHYGITVA